MTDLEDYVSRLAEKSDYQNCCLPREPRLDIPAEINPSLWRTKRLYYLLGRFRKRLPPVRH